MNHPQKAQEVTLNHPDALDGWKCHPVETRPAASAFQGVCQVADPTVDLPCVVREGGGLRCERTDEHGDDHVISKHTIEHSLAGNGYSCSSSSGDQA